MSLHELLRAGLLAIITVGAPAGIQGPVVTGMQGIGVSTPCAAAVALATVGFAIEEHMPKGKMFFMGTLSMMVAAGKLPTMTLFSGVTNNVDGAAPNEHCNVADITTCCPIMRLTLLIDFNPLYAKA
jgi:hypothetical protein